MTNQAEQAKNTIELSPVINDKHKKVVDNILTGMGKAKAYRQIYNRCNSDSAAWHALRAIMKRPEVKAYYESELEHKQKYIAKDNELTINQLQQINKSALNQLQRLADKAEADNNYGQANNALNNILKAVDNVAKQLGIGAYDPSIKLVTQNKLRELQEEQKQLKENNQLNNDETINILAKMIEE